MSFLRRMEPEGIESRLRRIDARCKILVLLGVVLAAVSTPVDAWWIFPGYWAALLVLGLAGRVPARFALARLTIVLPFTLFVLVFVPFRAPDFGMGERWVDVGFLRFSSGGLRIVAGVLLKSATSVAALVVLAATTPFAELLQGFRRLGVPAVFVEITSFAWRYLAVLGEEAQRMVRARDMRAWRGRWLWQAWVVGTMVGHLFLRAFERAERIHQAMLARGYDGDAKVLVAARSPRLSAVFLLAGTAWLVVARGAAWLML